jgi:hypothetical protein
MNFKKWVMNYALIKYDRMIIPNGMITLEHYDDDRKMTGVQVK